MAVIGVDIDLTVVRSDLAWFEWCNSMSVHKHSHDDFIVRGEQVPYNFEKIYPDLSHDEIMQFWRRENVYDTLVPVDGSVKALHRLSAYHEIVFVTALKGLHHKSKYKFAERHFPFMSGFIGTKEKQYAGVDVLVDDRISILQKAATKGIRPVWMFNNYTQDIDPLGSGAHVLHSWDCAEDVIDQALTIKGY